MGIPRVHHADNLLAASMHGHTSSLACHMCTLLKCSGGEGGGEDCIMPACYWTTLQMPMRLQLYCRRQLRSGSTSISVCASDVSSGPDRVLGNLFPGN